MTSLTRPRGACATHVARPVASQSLAEPTNRRNFASYSWNRRANTQQSGEQQGIFPILGFDWRS